MVYTCIMDNEVNAVTSGEEDHEDIDKFRGEDAEAPEPTEGEAV